MEVDLPAVSTQGGADGTVQDTTVPENIVHQPNAPENGANNKNQMSYADHLKETQGIAGGVGRLYKICTKSVICTKELRLANQKRCNPFLKRLVPT